MRAAKRLRHFAHRDGAPQNVVDETLGGGEPLRPMRLERQDGLRPGHRPPRQRPLGVEMKLPRLEDRLDHSQRIQRLDFDRDAHQARPAVSCSRSTALREKRAQRVGRGIGSGIQGQDDHDSA